MAEQYTLEEFGKRIKAKYPQYASFSDTDIANKVLAKYPQYRSSIKAGSSAPPKSNDSLSATDLTTMEPHQVPHSLRNVGTEALRSLSNIGSAGLNALEHPLDTVASVVTQFKPYLPTYGPGFIPVPNLNGAEQGMEVIQHPLETAEGFVGQAGALGGAEEALRPLTGSLLNKVSNARQNIRTMQAKTGSPFIAKVVDDVQAANKDIANRNQLAADRARERNDELAAEHERKVHESFHETEGREHAYKAAVKNKTEEIQTQEASEAAKQKAEHEAAVAKTRADNAAALSNAESAYKKAQDDYLRESAEHQQKTAATEADNKKLQDAHDAEVKAQESLQDELNKNDRAGKKDLKALEKRVHDDADAQYEALREKLYDKESDPEKVNAIVEDVIGQMNESDSEPPLLAKLRKSAENGVLTYGDLDGFRSKLGAELRKGTLPGSLYHLYETLQDGITDEMTRIAEDNGMQKQALAARAAWRQWADAFRDRRSPWKKILDNREQHGLLSGARGRQSYIDGLRAMGPDGAALADQIGNGLNAAQASKARYTTYGQIEVPEPKAPVLAKVPEFKGTEPAYTAPKLKEAPKPPTPQLTAGSPEERARQQVKQPERVEAPDRPREVKPKVIPTKVLTPEELTAIKRAQAVRAARGIYNASNHLATVFVVIEGIRQLLKGNPGAILVDAAGRYSYAGWKAAYAKALESPKFLDAVSKLSPDDVKAAMRLPEDQRQGFEDMLLQAQSQGVKLQPGVMGVVFGVSSSTRNLPRTQHLKQLRDRNEYTDNSQQ